jgi:hypothetical protein
MALELNSEIDARGSRNSVKAKIVNGDYNAEFGWFRPSQGGMTRERFLELLNIKNSGLDDLIYQATLSASSLNAYALIDDESSTENDYEAKRKKFIDDRMDDIDLVSVLKSVFGHAEGRTVKIDNKVLFFCDSNAKVNVNVCEYVRSNGKTQVVRSKFLLNEKPSLTNNVTNFVFQRSKLILERYVYEKKLSLFDIKNHVPKLPVPWAEAQRIRERIVEKDYILIRMLFMRVLNEARIKRQEPSKVYMETMTTSNMQMVKAKFDKHQNEERFRKLKDVLKKNNINVDASPSELAAQVREREIAAAERIAQRRREERATINAARAEAKRVAEVQRKSIAEAEAKRRAEEEETADQIIEDLEKQQGQQFNSPRRQASPGPRTKRPPLPRRGQPRGSPRRNPPRGRPRGSPRKKPPPPSAPLTPQQRAKSNARAPPRGRLRTLGKVVMGANRALLQTRVQQYKSALDALEDAGYITDEEENNLLADLDAMKTAKAVEAIGSQLWGKVLLTLKNSLQEYKNGQIPTSTAESRRDYAFQLVQQIEGLRTEDDDEHLNYWKNEFRSIGQELKSQLEKDADAPETTFRPPRPNTPPLPPKTLEGELAKLREEPTFDLGSDSDSDSSWSDDEAKEPQQAAPIRIAPVRRSSMTEDIDKNQLKQFVERRNSTLECLKLVREFYKQSIGEEKRKEIIQRLNSISTPTPDAMSILQGIESFILRTSAQSVKNDIVYLQSLDENTTVFNIEKVLQTTIPFCTIFSQKIFNIVRPISPNYTEKFERALIALTKQRVRLEKLLETLKAPSVVSMPSTALFEEESVDGTVANFKAPSVESMPMTSMFEAESIEGTVANFKAGPAQKQTQAAQSMESMPMTAMFEAESVVTGAIPHVDNDCDDAASIINSVISGEEHVGPYSGTMKFKGVELPVNDTDVNLASLINDKDLWELSSMESEVTGSSFDITDADMDQFDWEVSSNEM